MYVYARQYTLISESNLLLRPTLIFSNMEKDMLATKNIHPSLTELGSYNITIAAIANDGGD